MTVINKYPNGTSEKELAALAYQAHILLSAMNLPVEKPDAILDSEDRCCEHREVT